MFEIDFGSTAVRFWLALGAVAVVCWIADWIVGRSQG